MKDINSLLIRKDLLLFVVCFLFILRFIFTVSCPLRGDEREYQVISHKISFDSRNLNLPVEDPLVKHPLLAVYAMKLSISLFGDSPLGVRFFSLLCSFLSLIILYKFLVSACSPRAGLFGILLLGLNIFHISSTLANSLTLFFSLCSIILFWKGTEENKGFLIALSGAVIAVAYLNKELVAGLLPCFLVYSALCSQSKRKFIKTAAILVSSFVIILAPYFMYIYKFGSISRLLNKNYMLNFGLNLSAIDFYLVRLRGFLSGIDYRSFISWEHYPMDFISGAILILGTLLGFLFLRGRLYVLMAIIFCFFFIVISVLRNAEHAWVQITLIPAIFFSAEILSRWTEKRRFIYLLVTLIVIFMVISSLKFLYTPCLICPPYRFAKAVDYDTDLMEWFYYNNRLDEAIKETKEALSICPNEIRIINMAGVFYAARGQRDIAGHFFRKALAIDPKFGIAKSNLVLIESGEVDIKEFTIK